jgi:hypothetical protein
MREERVPLFALQILRPKYFVSVQWQNQASGSNYPTFCITYISSNLSQPIVHHLDKGTYDGRSFRESIYPKNLYYKIPAFAVERIE